MFPPEERQIELEFFSSPLPRSDTPLGPTLPPEPRVSQRPTRERTLIWQVGCDLPVGFGAQTGALTSSPGLSSCGTQLPRLAHLPTPRMSCVHASQAQDRDAVEKNRGALQGVGTVQSDLTG